jgi:hypothetical protein
MLKALTMVKNYFSKGKSNASKLTQRIMPASPPKAKTRLNKVIESIDYSDLPKLPESKRTGGQGAGKNYVDILSSSEE